MDFHECLESGTAKEVPINILRAKSLIKSSKQAIKTAEIIRLNEDSAKSVFRELYEGLREFIEAIGFSKGYKFLDHISITYFLKEILKEPLISRKFDRYRKLRNGINYYGNDIDTSTVKEALKEIPLMVNKLKK